MKRGEFAFMAVVGAAIAIGLFLVLAPSIIAYHDPSALSLGASLNATVVAPNQTISLRMTDTNTLYFHDVLAFSSGWRLKNLSVPPCDSSPFGIGVYQGRYTLGNISSATSLAYYPQGLAYFGCSIEWTNSFNFGPRQTINDSAEIHGYFTPGYTTLPGGGETWGIFHPYKPGTYTVAVGDEWGHVVLLYFRVT